MATSSNQEMSFKRRYFKAFELCALHLDDIKNNSDPESELWRALRKAEKDKFERLKLWQLVIACARQFHGFDFVELSNNNNRCALTSESIEDHRSTLKALRDK